MESFVCPVCGSEIADSGGYGKAVLCHSCGNTVVPDPKTNRPFGLIHSDDLPEADPVADAAEKRRKNEQYKAKLPFLIVWLACSGYLVLDGLSSWESDAGRSLLTGVVGTFATLYWFFYGTEDWTHPWRQIKQGLFSIGRQSPSSNPPAAEEDEELPTSFGGWVAAVVGACFLIWYFVRLVWRICESILN